MTVNWKGNFAWETEAKSIRENALFENSCFPCFLRFFVAFMECSTQILHLKYIFGIFYIWFSFSCFFSVGTTLYRFMVLKNVSQLVHACLWVDHSRLMFGAKVRQVIDIEERFDSTLPYLDLHVSSRANGGNSTGASRAKGSSTHKIHFWEIPKSLATLHYTFFCLATKAR